MLSPFQDKDRPLAQVPTRVLVLLVVMLALQLLWHSQQAPVVAKAGDLPRPLSAHSYTIGSMGESITAAKLLNLWLQAFDNQPGVSLSFSQLDYARITEWLDTILALDPNGPYPMLVAARVYGGVSDRERQRFMMDYIFHKFKQAPNRHWRWMAHAVIVAKHELKDMPLALKYAEALAQNASGANVPYWARDMRIIVLEDMGEITAAKMLVRSLIESGEITDAYELNFLTEKIRVLEEKSSKNQQNVENSSKKLR